MPWATKRVGQLSAGSDMSGPIEKVECRTTRPGAKPISIPKWKYDVVSRGILNVLKSAPGQGVPFKDLPDRVKAELKPEELLKLGSITWHVTTVKLEMEVRGTIERVPGSSPQRLQLKTSSTP